MVGEGLPGKYVKLIRNRIHDSGTRIPILLKPRKRLLLKHGLHAAFGFPLYAEGKLQAVLEFFSETNQPPDQHVLMSCKALESSLGGFSSANKAKSNNARRSRLQMFSI